MKYSRERHRGFTELHRGPGDEIGVVGNSVAVAHRRQGLPALALDHPRTLDWADEDDVRVATQHILEGDDGRWRGERVVDVAAPGNRDELRQKAAAADGHERLLPDVHEHRWSGRADG